jgi:large subunit ribosomal protein L35
MPKLKTKKGVAKRFRLTKTKKVKYTPSGKSHLMSCKEPERLRRLRRSNTIRNKKHAKYLKRMLPYG